MSAEAERWREARTIYGRADLPKVVKAGDALLAALVALEAGVREIRDHSSETWARRKARDLLAGRAAGGEG